MPPKVTGEVAKPHICKSVTERLHRAGALKPRIEISSDAPRLDPDQADAIRPRIGVWQWKIRTAYRKGRSNIEMMNHGGMSES